MTLLLARTVQFVRPMKRMLGLLMLALFLTALASTTIACQPCEDPSQLFCPDE